MANVTSNFTSRAGMELLGDTARAGLSPNEALGYVIAASRVAESQPFHGPGWNSAIVMSGTYPNQDNGLLTGSNMHVANGLVMGTVYSLLYYFAAGVEVRVSGEWNRDTSDRSLLGETKLADVSFGTATVSFAGAPVPPGGVGQESPWV